MSKLTRILPEMRDRVRGAEYIRDIEDILDETAEATGGELVSFGDIGYLIIWGDTVKKPSCTIHTHCIKEAKRDTYRLLRIPTGSCS